MASVQNPVKAAKPKINTQDSSEEIDNYEVHSNLISSSRLLKILEDRLPADSFTIEMRHSIYIIRAKRSCTKEAQALFKELANNVQSTK